MLEPKKLVWNDYNLMSIEDHQGVKVIDPFNTTIESEVMDHKNSPPDHQNNWIP